MLVRETPTGSHWISYKMIKGKRQKQAFVYSDQSRKDLLRAIHIKIITLPPRPLNRKPHLPVGKRRERHRPWKFTRFKIEKLSNTRYLYSSSHHDAAWIIQRTGEGWMCRYEKNRPKLLREQQICVGMETHDMALLELQYYLDSSPSTPEEWDDYMRICIRNKEK